MRIPRYFAYFCLVWIPLLAVTAVLANGRDKVQSGGNGLADEHRRAAHALNRLTFGPRPGEVARVAQMGVDRWIDLQLHPERIDDSGVNNLLAQYRTLRMSTREMAEDFPPPAVVKAVMDGKLPMPSDPARRAIYEAQIDRLRGDRNLKQTPAQNGAEPSGNLMRQDDDKAMMREERQFAEERAATLLQLSPDQRYREILAMNAGDRRLLAERLPEPERMRMLADLKPEQRETVMALVNRVGVVQSELMEGKLLRAIDSERQLEEVMTDFWFNHFNVFIGKGADRYLITSYERDVVRAHALGKFRDLLMATAKSPAMLFYLDNWMSVGPDSDFARYGPERRPQGRPPLRVRRRVVLGVPYPPRPPRTPRPARAKGNQSGLNENYARELMELHTLGVNGGYTQHDVTEVARVFTGWTLQEPRRGGNFEFDERKHERGTKYVLGHKIKQHGEKEGEEVLNILAHHPSTARFLSTELAQRFVSDRPPQTLIDKMARTFLKKDGDIREVLRTMFQSPEFWSPDVYRARVKTPLEFVASAVRASGAEVANPMVLVHVLNRMGMPLYGSQPPTGYKTAAEIWVNSSALLDRMNFALAMATGKLPGITVPAGVLLPGNPDASPAETLAQLENSLLADGASPQTNEAIMKQVGGAQPVSNPPRPANVALVTGLLLGSPEFQRK